MNIIYADTLFALSVFTDYLLLVVTARFCSLRLRRWCYLAAAVLGGVYAVAVFLPGMTWLAHPLCELCAAGFMGLIAFGGEEKLFRCCAAFLAVSASFGGAAWAVCMQRPDRGAPDLRLLIGVFLCSYAVLTLLSYTRRRRAREHLAAVTLALGPRSAVFTALEDSG
ncbi:MAG: sigma-E processing peptidase SpoIIGA, partial [Oscillospiraceae bacterium]|nr:sigma-E processing peptidase SpoIIGA [Oscillospiraceae bacterium]